MRLSVECAHCHRPLKIEYQERPATITVFRCKHCCIDMKDLESGVHTDGNNIVIGEPQ